MKLTIYGTAFGPPIIFIDLNNYSSYKWECTYLNIYIYIYIYIYLVIDI